MADVKAGALPGGSTTIHRLMDELVQMHNDLHHPGDDCPSEDEDGACSIRSGKPPVAFWTDHGLERRNS